MSPRKVTSVEKGALSRIAERVLDVQSLTHEHGHDGVVIAVQHELVARPGELNASARSALEEVAEPVEPTSAGPTANVTVLDSGRIWLDPSHLGPSHRNLGDRVTVVRGRWLDTKDGTRKHDEPDELYTDSAGRLDGISGYGTFIAGLTSNVAPDTRLEVVGQRNQEVEIGPLTRRKQLGPFETELAIAHAMPRRCNTDVLQCGFAFPTLDDYPSVGFASVMEELRGENAPHGGRVGRREAVWWTRPKAGRSAT